MKPNIILVLLDGSRTDRLSISKDFLSVQKKGTLVNNVTAAYPYTFAAINAIFTGLFGKENGVDAYYKMFKLKNSVDFLPEILRSHGYFTACDLISEKVISKRGFDIYQSHDEYVDDLTTKHPDLIRNCFKKSNGKPIFTFLQFSKIHTATVSEVLKKYDWDDKNYYKNQKNNLNNYDDAFHEAAKYAKIIQNTIDQLKKSDETIIIFFCDHGTGIGERFGERNYGVFTFEETIRTYFLFIGPTILENKISNKLLTTLQILPTILELCEIKINSIPKEPSFASFLIGNSLDPEEKNHTFSETGGLQGPSPSPKKPNVFCIKTINYKLIYYQTLDVWELYDLKNDPKEIKNLSGLNFKIEQTLKIKLLNWINR
jgi:arylsulfatase A-like enzyme